MLTMSHDDLTALLARHQSQPWTLTPEQIALVEHGQSTAMGAAAFAVEMGSAGGDGYNPRSDYARKAQAAAEFATVTLAANRPPKPVLTERQRVRAMNAAGRESFRASAGIPRHEFSRWLWASEPRQTAYAATDVAVAWAKKVLGTAA